MNKQINYYKAKYSKGAYALLSAFLTLNPLTFISQGIASEQDDLRSPQVKQGNLQAVQAGGDIKQTFNKHEGGKGGDNHIHISPAGQSPTPRTAQDYFNEGRDFFTKIPPDYIRAATCFLNAAGTVEQHLKVEAYIHHGLCMYHQKDYSRAVSDYEQALTLQTNDEAYRGLMKIYYEIGNEDEEDIDYLKENYEKALEYGTQMRLQKKEDRLILKTVKEKLSALGSITATISVAQKVEVLPYDGHDLISVSTNLDQLSLVKDMLPPPPPMNEIPPALKGPSVEELVENLKKGKKINQMLNQLDDYANSEESDLCIEACKALAKIYEEGDIEDEDIEKAFGYWKKASDYGDAESQFKVGDYYEKGKGTTQDLKAAKRYYTFASRQGLEKATKALAELNKPKTEEKKPETPIKGTPIKETPAKGGMAKVVEHVMEQNRPVASPSSALSVPAFAKGYEEIYNRFVNGTLVFDNGKGQRKEFPFSQFANTLEGEFDLSGLTVDGYDVSEYLSINLGFRRGKNPAHKDKLEVWILPKFLMGIDIDGAARHYKSSIWSRWNSDVGILWTWGNWDDGDVDCDYLLNKKFEEITDQNLLKLWRARSSTLRYTPPGHPHRHHRRCYIPPWSSLSFFSLIF